MRKIPVNGTVFAVAIFALYLGTVQLFLERLAVAARVNDSTIQGSEFSPMAFYMATVLAKSGGLFIVLFLFLLNPLTIKPAREWLFAALAIIFGFSIFWLFPRLT